MELSTLLSGFLGVLALLSLIASAAAIAKANYAKSTIETLEKSNGALAARVKIIEDEAVRKDTTIASLTSQNVALQTYVSGTDAIEKLAAMLTILDGQRKAEHNDILSAIEVYQSVFNKHHAEITRLLDRTTHTHTESSQ